MTPKGNPRLLQLLNPGFDSRVRVYVYFKKNQVGNSPTVTTSNIAGHIAVYEKMCPAEG